MKSQPIVEKIRLAIWQMKRKRPDHEQSGVRSARVPPVDMFQRGK